MKSVTVAFATFQESVRQPAFYALLVLGAVLLGFSYVMPTFTLDKGEVKFVRDIGLGTYTLCIFLLGIFSASNLITTEIDNKTAMTLMSKPLKRYEFVVGKYLGISLSVLFLAILLAALFLIVIVGKLYSGDIVWQLSNPYERMWPEISVIFPGLLVGLLQALVLVAVGVALSTRLPMILNVSVCFALYVIASVSGPLLDYLAREQSGLLKVTRVIYWVLPNLRNNTEIFSAIGLGKPVPFAFVAWASLYSLLYIFAAICVGVFLFQDRELG